MCPERFVTYVSGRSPLNLTTLLFSTPAFGLALVLAPSWPQVGPNFFHQHCRNLQLAPGSTLAIQKWVYPHETYRGAKPHAFAGARHLDYRGLRQVWAITRRGSLDEKRRVRRMVLRSMQGWNQGRHVRGEFPPPGKAHAPRLGDTPTDIYQQSLERI